MNGSYKLNLLPGDLLVPKTWLHTSIKLYDIPLNQGVASFECNHITMKQQFLVLSILQTESYRHWGDTILLLCNSGLGWILEHDLEEMSPPVDEDSRVYHQCAYEVIRN
jgi:hypothetical protein